jgi:Gas vesicle synthesis protein GvpO
MTERSQQTRARRTRPSEGAASSRNGSAGTRVSATVAARKTKEQLQELLGTSAEQVTAVNRSEKGWVVTVEMLELRRIPETMDVLGVYEVELSRRGQVVAWHRTGRHHRSEVDS